MSGSVAVRATGAVAHWSRRFAAGACLLLALYYAGSAAFAIWHYGWTELFSDQFRQYTNLLARPFPDNVLAPDNSHRQITSNLLRLADLHWRGADQDLGVVAGLLMLLTVLVILVVRIARDRANDALSRAAAILFAAIALMWMGSGRMQFHGNESFQIYLVMACALIVLACVESLRVRPTWRVAAIAVFVAAVAMVSFGTGIAVFGLLISMLVVRRVEARWSLSLSVLAVSAVFAYMFLLPQGESVRSVLSFGLLDVARNAPSFLASFWTNSWLSYADAGVAGVDASRMATMSIGGIVVASAQAVFALAGDPSLLALAAAIGTFGLLVLGWYMVVAWRHADALGSMAALGLGLAIFAAGVALLVAFGRGDYFTMYPGQVLADRYVPWSSLFWLGLALVLGARLAPRRFGPAAFATCALLVATLFYPSHRFGYGWAAAVGREIERRAAQIQSELHAEGLAGFADMPDLASTQRALAALREHRVGMFRAPRNHLLATTPSLPATGERPLALIGGLSAVAESDAAEVPAWHVEGRLLDPASRRDIDGLVIVDADGRVIGIGEFSFRTHAAGWARIDDMADGFDAYLRAAPPCNSLRMYGVDASATRFIALGRLPECTSPPSQSE